MTRCISCGRLPTEDHCEICHRAVRAIARIADAIGYEETARELRELVEGFGDPGGEAREVNAPGVPE